ncbi:hypothetical protein KQH82_08380 [bacterium]|nr:hypothetical protein [bacterium]
MSSERNGVNIVTAAKRLLALVSLVALLSLAVGCGSDSSESAADRADSQPAESGEGRLQFSGEHAEEKAQMQALVDEIIERFKYHDKAPLWENEFSYLHDRATFDEYLEYDHIKHFNPDSVDHIDLDSFEFHGDTCYTWVTVYFEGPTGKVSTDHDVYPFYFHKGRWIRPTFTSNPSGIREQQEYERIMYQADSAAKAEAEEGL